jgi:CRP/FNR family transcriptional regulator, cyclic AMP receptor protein
MSYQMQVAPRSKRRIIRPAIPMKTPYGLEVIESCLTCPLTTERLFCHLPKPTLAGLDAISSSATYPKGAILFTEGQEPRGVFILCNGRVKLSASSAEGKSLILRVAEAGEVVGLPGTISGKTYEATAEALEPIQANFVPRDAFLKFLRNHGDVALRVAEMLSDIYHATYREVRYLGLSGSAAGKLARFLLDRVEGAAAKQGEEAEPMRAVLTLTHEEIAEMIGASRETVTRVFADFKKKKFVEVHGSTVIIRDQARLQKIVGA